MEPEVIGITTAPACIAKMLGVEKDSEYGMYEETQMGKYYARLLPDGSFDSKLVRLISDEQADRLEAAVLASIERVRKGIPYFAACIPAINMECSSHNIAGITQRVKQSTGVMGSDHRRRLEDAGFTPCHSNR